MKATHLMFKPYAKEREYTLEGCSGREGEGGGVAN